MAKTGGGSYAGKIGWTVGRADWLDRPASKVNRYWRSMEHGQTYTGLTLIGLWGDRAGGSRNSERLLRTGGPLTAAEPSRQNQKFVAFGATNTPATALRRARFAFWYYVTKGKMGTPTDADLMVLKGDPQYGGRKGQGKNALTNANRGLFWWIMQKAELSQIPFVSARAVRPVIARHYYRSAVGKFNPMEVQKAMLKQEARTFLNGVFSMSKARASVGAQGNQGARKAGAREVSPAQGVKYFGSRVGQVTIISGAAQQSLLRTANGQWPSGLWQQMLMDVNAKVAYQFQLAVVAGMQKHHRPATGDLIEATLDDRNRYPK